MRGKPWENHGKKPNIPMPENIIFPIKKSQFVSALLYIQFSNTPMLINCFIIQLEVIIFSRRFRHCFSLQSADRSPLVQLFHVSVEVLRKDELDESCKAASCAFVMSQEDFVRLFRIEPPSEVHEGNHNKGHNEDQQQSTSVD